MNIPHWHFWANTYGDYTACGKRVDQLDVFRSPENMFRGGVASQGATFCTLCQEVATLRLLAETAL